MTDSQRYITNRQNTAAPFVVGVCSAIITLALIAALSFLRESVIAGGPIVLPAIGVLTLLSLGINAAFLGMPFVSATNLYLLMVWCFHMGLVLPGSLGISVLPLSILGNSEEVILGALCTLLAFSAFQSGVCLVQFLRIQKAAPPRVGAHHDARRSRYLFTVGITACAVLVGAGLWDLRKIGITHFLSQAYNSSLYQTADLRIYKTALAMSGTMVLVALAGTSSRAQRRCVLALAGVLVSYLAMVGDRGFAFTFALSFAFVWRSIGYAVSRRTMVLAAVCCIVAAPTIRIARGLEAADRSLLTTLSEADYFGTLEEMGSSFKTLTGTLALVPQEQPYRLGGSYATAVSYVLPNLGSELGRGFKDLDQLDPALWITAMLEPTTYAVGGGLGYSAIAEPYLNFGFVGVAIFFVLAGAFLSGSDVMVPGTASRAAIAARAVVLYPLLITARNDMTNFVRPAVWGLLIIAIICSLPARSPRLVQLRSGIGEQLA